MSAITFRLFEMDKESITSTKKIIFLKRWGLVGINTNDLSGDDLIKLKKDFGLYNFESSQEKIKCLIEHGKELDITFTNIKFLPELDFDDKKTIKELLQNKNYEELAKILEELYNSDWEIDEINFVLGKKYNSYEGAHISITRFGILETEFRNSIEIEFIDLFSNEFLGILSGKWS